MVTLFFHTNDPSKRKAVQWLTQHGITVTQRNIEKEPLTQAEVLDLLAISMDGTEDLISKRSRDTKALKMDSENVTINQLTAAVATNPHILRNPIIFNENKLVTGFDQEKMGVFIPKRQRRLELNRLLGKLTPAMGPQPQVEYAHIK